MRVIIAAVGRPKDAALAAAIREYEHRAAHYWPLEPLDVKAERAEGGISPALVKAREGDRLSKRIRGVDTVVACDAAGTGMTSERFADWLQLQRENARDVAFLIGGAFGLDDALRTQATMCLSLSPWTLPHDLARLVLAEQLYRAGTIVKREPYHK